MNWIKDLNYQCDSCHKVVTHEQLQCFVCECRGTFRIFNSGLVTEMTEFLPYYDTTLKMEITSAAHRNREFKKAGLYVSQDDKKMMKRWKYARKNKEDFVREQFKRDGKSYKSGHEWSDTHNDFVRTNRSPTVYSFG